MRETPDVAGDVGLVIFDGDGVRDLIEALRRQAVPTCIASSGSHRKMDLTLVLTGLHELFEGRIYSGSDVERGKP